MTGGVGPRQRRAERRALGRRARFTIVVVTGALAGALLIGISQLGAGDATSGGRNATSHTGAASSPVVRSPFAGVPQRAATLGSQNAPVTLVEYADLQCPYCAEWASRALPTLVDRYVRTGALRIVFRGLAFIGPDSEKALRAALAAGEQDRLWEVVHGMYERQGPENTGWVSDDLIAEVAAGVRGLDAEKLSETQSAGPIERQMEQSARAAQAAGIHGTPAFQVGPTGGSLELVQVGSLDAAGLVPTIEAALAR